MHGNDASARRLAAACLFAVGLALPSILSAHDIPNDTTIQTFVRAEGQQVHLLVRVPIIAMRDIIFPQKDADNIDLSRADITTKRPEKKKRGLGQISVAMGQAAIAATAINNSLERLRAEERHFRTKVA